MLPFLVQVFWAAPQEPYDLHQQSSPLLYATAVEPIPVLAQEE